MVELFQTVTGCPQQETLRQGTLLLRHQFCGAKMRPRQAKLIHPVSWPIQYEFAMGPVRETGRPFSDFAQLGWRNVLHAQLHHAITTIHDMLERAPPDCVNRSPGSDRVDRWQDDNGGQSTISSNTHNFCAEHLRK
jgi:hypothetical protein